MKRQTILVPILGDNKNPKGTVINDKSLLRYEVKLPKIIRHVSAFEMQFGMKEPIIPSSSVRKEGLSVRTSPYGSNY